MHALVLFAVIYGGGPRGDFLHSAVTPQLSVCSQFDDLALSPTARLVVYSVHEPELEGTDTEHRVYVSLVHRHSEANDWKVVDRKEVTEYLLNNGETGLLERIAVLANDFTVEEHHAIDVSILSGISGNGGISRVDDIFYVVRGDALHHVGTLEGTAGWWRGGSRSRGETRSTLQVVGSSLVWSRSERIVEGTDEATSKTTCREEQRVYRWRNGVFVPDASAEAKFVKRHAATLPRFELRTTIQCEKAR